MIYQGGRRNIKLCLFFMPGCIIEYLSGHLYVDILKKEVVPCRHAYSSFFFLRKCHICIHGFAFLKTATHFPWYLQNYARRWHFSAVNMIEAKQQKNIRACMYMFHALETRLRRCPTSSGYDRNLFSPNLLDFWFLIEFISDAESKIFCSFEY